MLSLNSPQRFVALLLTVFVVMAMIPSPAQQSSANVAVPDNQKDISKRLRKLEKEAQQTKKSKQYKDISAASEQVAQLGIADWLGPMAPVALSPFFAITLLAGAACFGGDWIPAGTPLLGEGSPLANPAIFWIFLVLTIITSLPRFSKVSKPLAQLVDFLETYSAIITMIVLRLITLLPVEAETEIQQAGILAMGMDGLLMIAMAVNIVVINTVKFFFEFLVWITPIPSVDLIFEACNKAICAALMAIYTFSPLLALILNLFLFAICLIVFAWVKRREVFCRSILVDLVLGWFKKGRSEVDESETKLFVFPRQPVESIPTMARCLLENSETGWKLTQKRILFRSRVIEFSRDEHQMIMSKGWFACTLHISEHEFKFTRRYATNLEKLAALYSASVAELNAESKQWSARWRFDFT